jgi:ribosomal protein S18 acetylase RimI-like enzyme
MAYIHFVGVHPGSRGLGIARRLYELFFDLVRQERRTTGKAISAPVNAGSIAIHRRMGFAVSEPVEDYDRPGVAHVVVRREL